MALVKERNFVPSKSYDVQVKIKGYDFTQDLYRLRIVSSINAPYQTFVLNIFMSPHDIILNKLFGKDAIKLNIRLLNSDGKVTEQIDFELMYLDSQHQVPMVSQKTDTKQTDRTSYEIVTIPRKAFKTMSYFVNDVFVEKKIEDVIRELSSKVGCDLKIDTDDLNTEVIDQVVITPSSFFPALKNIDETFGVYNGPCSFWCSKDNTLFVRNLTKRMTKDQTFTIHHLSTDSEKTKEIIEKSVDGKNFYSYSKIDSSYSGNTTLGVVANNVNNIVKPKDDLYYVIKQVSSDVAGKHGVISKNNQFDYDDIIKDNTKYNILHTGYEKTEFFANAALSKLFSGLSNISFEIERNLHILNLMNVGECVKFNASTLEFTDLTGKYILKSSDINFRKEKEWQATAKIYLMRTNKTI